MRHGEVHNPDGVLYGRRPGYHLSDLGRQMAEKVADSVKDRDIIHLRVSPLERAQETAQPLAAAARARRRHRRAGDRVDQRVRGRGLRAVGAARCGSPKAWRHLWNPFKPSWGEPYKEVVARMMAAVEDARDAAARPRGRDRVPPAADLDRPAAAEKQRVYAHDPRRRQCTLCSLTSLHFVDDTLAKVTYSEPAGDLIPTGDKAAPFSAGGAPEEQRP